MNANPGAPAMEVRDLHKRFGTTEVLRGVTLSVQHGQIAAIIGASGGGKSTLLRCMNFLERPDSGEILIDGEPVGWSRLPDGTYQNRPRAALYRQRAKMPMVFQRFNLFQHLTAIENVMIGCVQVLGQSRQEALRKGHEGLERVGLSAKAQSYPAQLSGGQQQRVAIARALAMDPEVVLFDEPTSSLDPELVGGVLDVIEDLAAGGLTMIVVTHEMEFARTTADWVYFMDEGKVSEEGRPEQIFDHPQNARTEAFVKGISSSRRNRPE